MDPINFRISKFAVLVDTNVLYPAYLRDLVLRLALRDTFRIHWSQHILDELKKALLTKAHLTEEQITYIQDRMAIAFPDALVSGEEDTITHIKLPDPDDHHVISAALLGRCDLIITANTSDFPPEVLAPLGLEAQHPDKFLTNHLSLEKNITLETVKEHIKALQRPSMNFDEYLACLVGAGLVLFPNTLKEAEKLIVS